MRTLRFEREPVAFDGVSDRRSIKRLEIAFCDVESLDGVASLAALEEMHVHYCRSLTDLSAIESLRTLRQVNLYSLPNVEIAFRPAKLPRLERLSFTNVRRLSTIRGIETLKRLTYLGLSAVKVEDGDYAPIVACKSLRRVFWHGAPFKAPALKEIRAARPDVVVGGNRT